AVVHGSRPTASVPPERPTLGRGPALATRVGGLRGTSPAVVDLLGPAVQTGEPHGSRARPSGRGERARPRAEALVRRRRHDAEVRARDLRAEGLERRVDSAAGDAPRPVRVREVVVPHELVGEVVEAPVDEDRVLRRPRADRPPPPDLETDDAPVAL